VTSIAGIPAFLKDRLVYLRETRDNVYTPFPYVAANTIVAVPFVFMIALSFSLIAYYMIGLNNSTNAFFNFTGYLFLALMVAESMVLLVSSIFPVFVGALTIVSFINGLYYSALVNS
jgi:ABC-type multidrug transport system permease subunit